MNGVLGSSLDALPMLPSVTKPSMPILARVRTPREVDRMAYTTAARLGGIGGILGLVWVLAVSALMLVSRAGRNRVGPTRPGGVA